MAATLHRIVYLAGLAAFVAAVFKAEGWFVTASLTDTLALVAAGLACWIAATLP